MNLTRKNTSLLPGDLDKANARSNVLQTQQNIEITSASHSTDGHYCDKFDIEKSIFVHGNAPDVKEELVN